MSRLEGRLNGVMLGGESSGRGAVGMIMELGAPIDAKALVAEEVGVRSGGAIHARVLEHDSFSISKAR